MPAAESAGWRGAAFWLLNAVVLARAPQVLVALDGPAAAWPWIAVSGPLACAAFVAFAVVLGLTLLGTPAAAAIAARPAAPLRSAARRVPAWRRASRCPRRSPAGPSPAAR